MTEQSINTAFVALAQKLGVCAIGKTMTDDGPALLHGRADPRPEPGQRRPRVRRGVAGDRWPPPTPPSRRRAATARRCRSCPSSTRSKKSLPVQASKCSQALDPDVANGVTKVLSTVLTAGHRRGQPAQGRPSGVRQDRHHRQQQAVVVRRLHPAAVHRRLGGHPDGPEEDAQPDPRRQVLPARLRCHHRGADLEGHHGRGVRGAARAGLRRAQRQGPRG